MSCLYTLYVNMELEPSIELSIDDITAAEIAPSPENSQSHVIITKIRGMSLTSLTD